MLSVIVLFHANLKVSCGHTNFNFSNGKTISNFTRNINRFIFFGIFDVTQSTLSEFFKFEIRVISSWYSNLQLHLITNYMRMLGVIIYETIFLNTQIEIIKKQLV